jgi:hypothetical protein
MAPLNTDGVVTGPHRMVTVGRGGSWCLGIFRREPLGTALARFIALTNDPNLTRAQLERKVWGIRLPFIKLPVWHRIKFVRVDPLTLKVSTADSIHCSPGRSDSRGNQIPGRFDTALINDGTGEETGLDGMSKSKLMLQLYT